MFFTKEWLERRYSYVVYRRGSGYLGVQISSGGRNRQGVQPSFPGISSKYASYGMERTGSFLLVAGMPGWHPGSAGSLRHHPAGTLVEVYATTLHYAPCHTDPANGFKVLVALPKGTNTDKPNMPIKGGDDAYLWACNKWLLAHPDSAEAAQGAVAALTGENIDIEKDL